MNTLKQTGAKLKDARQNKIGFVRRSDKYKKESQNITPSVNKTYQLSQCSRKSPGFDRFL